MSINANGSGKKVESQTIIIDAEIQDVVTKIAEPIFKVAGIKKPKIYIISDIRPNAFTNGGENIFITTSLISMFPDPNVLRGVIAHEVGHIVGNHVGKTEAKLDGNYTAATASVLLGTFLFMAGQGLDLGVLMGGAMISQHAAERSFLKFSRENETTADIKANNLLVKAGFDSSGLLKLLEHFNSTRSNTYGSVYDQTHPLSVDRINLLKSYHNTHNFIEDPNLKFSYEMAAAKLLAYTQNSPNLLKLSNDQKDYALSLIENKKYNKVKSLEKIDGLIKKYPNYPFFYLQRAEILTNFGDKNAIEFYSKALSLSKKYYGKNDIIQIEQSIAKIILLDSIIEIKNAISFLEINLTKFQNNLTIVKFLSLAYDKIGNKANSLYYRALEELLNGNIKLAKRIAQTAKVHAGNNNELILKIEDIINFEI